MAPARKKRAPAKAPDATSRPAKAKPPTRKMTEKRLRNIALFYVERFATTAANLRRVLQRRIDRACRVHGDDRREMAPWIEIVVNDFVRTGAVDDARYALVRATSLRRLGRSPQKISAHLRAKGVAMPLIKQVLDATAETESGGDAAYEAAVAYARRRRLGPFRDFKGTADERRKQTQKDLAALGRAGFSYDIARRIMTLAPDEVAA